MNILLAILCVILATLLFFSVRKNIQLIERVDNAIIQTNESLDVLDECYGKFTKILKTPVLSDEPVVKSFISDVANARNAVLLIANKLASIDEEGENVE